MKEAEYLERLQEYIESNQIDKAESLIDLMKDQHIKDSMVYMFKQILSIYRSEAENESKCCVFDRTTDINELADIYIRIKLLVKRLEYDIPGQEEMVEFCIVNRISSYYLKHIILTNVIFKKRVVNRLNDIFENVEKKDVLIEKYIDMLRNLAV